jgi:hypothetical protein
MPGLFARLHRIRPCRPRHPLLRAVFAVVGVGLLALLLVGGVFVGLGMLAFRAAQRLMGPRRSHGDTKVLEAEYRVVRPNALPNGR